jgi:Protein of unknown function (DUF4232)
MTLLNRMGRRRTLLPAAGCALVLTALATPSLGSSPPTCASSNLRVDRVGAMGFTSHRSWDLALRNVGSTTCSLNGFPAVRLLNSHARAMPTTVGHVSGPPHNTVLAPFHRAFFSFTFAVSAPCSAAVFAYGVRVAPPHASGRLVFYAGKFDLCGPAPAHVTVSPLSATRPF